MLMERGRNTIARAGILEQEEGVCSPLTEQLQSWPTFQAVRQLIDANPALELQHAWEASLQDAICFVREIIV